MEFVVGLAFAPAYDSLALDSTGADHWLTLPAGGDGVAVQMPRHVSMEDNLSYQATVAGSDVGGEVFPPGDVDLYLIEIAKDGPFVATITGVTDEACDAPLLGGLLDSELRLRTLDGALVARNDNAVGLCSALSLPLTKGKYLLEVRASSAAPDQVFSYLLHTSGGVTPQP